MRGLGAAPAILALISLSICLCFSDILFQPSATYTLTTPSLMEGDTSMTDRYTTRHKRTPVRAAMRGLWPMVAEPGPEFRWGVLLLRSTLNKGVDDQGEVTHFEHSTERQELEVV